MSYAWVEEWLVGVPEYLKQTVWHNRTKSCWPVSSFVSRWAGCSHSSTITVALFSHNYRCCSCSRIEHPGDSLTNSNTFQQCSQQQLSFAKCYGKYHDHVLATIEIIERLCPAELYTHRRFIVDWVTTFQHSTFVIYIWNHHPLESIWHS